MENINKISLRQNFSVEEKSNKIHNFHIFFVFIFMKSFFHDFFYLVFLQLKNYYFTNIISFHQHIITYNYH